MGFAAIDAAFLHRISLMHKPLSFLLVLALLTSCAGRPGPDVLKAVDTRVKGAKTIETYVVSTRQQEKGKTLAFGSGRAETPSYGRFTISIPPQHVKGKIEWATGKPDAQRNFIVTDRAMLARNAFNADVGRVLASGKQVGLFVHGFNYSYQEALFRAAQMAADANIDGTPLVFSWPSMGDVTGYVADKDSAIYSRDALVEVMADLARHTKGKNIVVFGHSMGGWLVMEALRQLRLEGRDDVLSKLQVVLAAPDIDIDVFRKQLEVVGKLNPPILVLVSKDDVALKASSFITNEKDRVGALDVTDPQISKAARDAGVQLVDISELSSADGLNHDRYASLAALVPQLDSRNNRNGNKLGQAGAFVLDSVGATIASPFRLASKAVNPY